MVPRGDALNKKIFTYDEAIAVLPDVQKLTAEAVAAVERIGEDAASSTDTASQQHEIITRWAAAVIDLGIEVKGLWLIDFDSGSGYYCWKYPEPTLQFFHDYDSGFGGRVELN